MPSALSYRVALLFTLFGALGTAIPLDDFYPFGTAHNDSSLPPNDDDSSEPILLNRPFPFFGSRHISLFVSLMAGNYYYNRVLAIGNFSLFFADNVIISTLGCIDAV